MLKVNTRRIGQTKATIKSIVNNVLETNNEDFLATNQKICVPCSRKRAIYTCPRCLIPYCSVQCYKSHSENCTENFYRFHVHSVLRLEKEENKKNPGNKKEMMRMLRGLDPDYEETVQAKGGLSLPEHTLLALLQALEEDEKIDLSTLLTSDEKMLFERAATGGHLIKYVSPWIPFWEKCPEQHPGITEIDVQTQADSEHEREDKAALEPDMDEMTIEECLHHSPQTILSSLEDIPALSTISSKNPSPTVRFMVLDLLVAGAFILRHYNGCWCDDVEEAVSLYFAVSPVLQDELKGMNMAQVLTASFEAIELQSKVAITSIMIKDLQTITARKTFMLSLLKDSKNMLECLLKKPQAKFQGLQTTLGKKKIRYSKKKVFLAHKTLCYFLSWTHQLQQLQLENLSFEITEFFETYYCS